MDPKQIRWRLRRGMRELDVLMERYFDQHYPTDTPEMQQCFVSLLEQEDPDIWRWLMGYAEPPEQYADLIQRLHDA